MEKIKNSLWFFMDGSAMVVFLVLLIFVQVPIIVIPFFIFLCLGFVNMIIIRENKNKYKTHKFKGRIIEVGDRYKTEYSINSIIGIDMWCYLGSFSTKEKGIDCIEKEKQEFIKKIIYEF